MIIKLAGFILYSLEGLLYNFDGRYNGPKLRAGESKLPVGGGGGILRKLLGLPWPDFLSRVGRDRRARVRREPVVVMEPWVEGQHHV